MKAAIYTRVSTADQNAELQLREVTDYAAKQSWEVVTDPYQDVISGAKASRPGLNRLMADATARKFDCLLVWKLDRFGRSLVDCLNNIRTLEDHGIRFIAVTQGLDTDQRNPASRLVEALRLKSTRTRLHGSSRLNFLRSSAVWRTVAKMRLAFGHFRLSLTSMPSTGPHRRTLR